MKRKLRWIIYKPNADCTAVEIEESGDRESNWDAMKEKIEPKSSRWIVYDTEWEAGDGRKMSKVCMIAYAADNAETQEEKQQKFVVAANKSTLMQKFKANRDFQINNYDDLTEHNLQKVFT